MAVSAALSAHDSRSPELPEGVRPVLILDPVHPGFTIDMAPLEIWHPITTVVKRQT